MGDSEEKKMRTGGRAAGGGGGVKQVARLIPWVLWCDVQEKKRKQEEAQKKKEADVEKEREMAARWVHDRHGDGWVGICAALG